MPAPREIIRCEAGRYQRRRGRDIPQTTAMRLAFNIAFTTFCTCAEGSADGTKKCGDCGKGDEASKGRNTVMKKAEKTRRLRVVVLVLRQGRGKGGLGGRLADVCVWREGCKSREGENLYSAWDSGSNRKLL